MLYWESNVEGSELSQSESATDFLRGALQDTNSGKKGFRKYGKLEVGFNLRNDTGGSTNYGSWHSGTTKIDFADFNSNGSLKGWSYNNVDIRSHNMARVFEHEYLGHQRLYRGMSADGTGYKTGAAVDITNGYRRERQLNERLHYEQYYDGRVLFGKTENFETPKALRKYVKQALKSNMHKNYIQRQKKK